LKKIISILIYDTCHWPKQGTTLNIYKFDIQTKAANNFNCNKVCSDDDKNN